MEEFAPIEVRELSKSYQIGSARRSTRLSETVAGLFAGNWLSQGNRDLMWALRDVSFRVERGEVFGVIGANGAGKSTLLKILSRITEPTEGCVYLRGKVSSLLEVGTGFHPELTGRENVFLNGAILGMTTIEIQKSFDEIVAFAEVERFIDTPVKHYSSGMQLRLAFAVAAHLEPDLLLVDEVLATGDAAFQRKCMGKIGGVIQSGRTVILVSHHLTAISQLCQRVMWLEQGQVRSIGKPTDVVAEYLKTAVGGDGEKRWSDSDTPGDQDFKLISVRTVDSRGRITNQVDTTEQFFIEVEYDVLRPMSDVSINIDLVSPEGVALLVTCDSDRVEPSPRAVGRYVSACTMPGALLNQGEYYISVGAGVPYVRRILDVHQVLSLTLTQARAPIGRPGERWRGVFYPSMRWSVRELANEQRGLTARDTTS